LLEKPVHKLVQSQLIYIHLSVFGSLFFCDCLRLISPPIRFYKAWLDHLMNNPRKNGAPEEANPGKNRPSNEINKSLTDEKLEIANKKVEELEGQVCCCYKILSLAEYHYYQYYLDACKTS
jgi:hypothetical protein